MKQENCISASVPTASALKKQKHRKKTPNCLYHIYLVLWLPTITNTVSWQIDLPIIPTLSVKSSYERRVEYFRMYIQFMQIYRSSQVQWDLLYSHLFIWEIYSGQGAESKIYKQIKAIVVSTWDVEFKRYVNSLKMLHSRNEYWNPLYGSLQMRVYPKGPLLKIFNSWTVS